RSSRGWPSGVRFRHSAVLLAVTALAWSACGTLSTEPGASVTLTGVAPRPLPECEWAEVLSVSDGDTIRVRLNGENERLRYIGIDAPELRPESGPPEPFAEEAAEANEQLVEGEDICLERDVSDRDRFGRLLRYAWLEDGTLVNEALVLAGLAEAVEFRPDTKHHDEILQPAEDRAMAARRGIWH
ncbi:MAG: thermonuclease family protein, partial [Dehalococcoidia bacterium]